MAGCASFKPLRPRFHVVEEVFGEVDGPEELVVPHASFFTFHGKVQRIDSPAQFDGPVHVPLMLLQAPQGSSRVVLDPQVPGFRVEAFQFPCLQHGLGLCGGLPPTCVERIDEIDEGLRGLKVTGQSKGAGGVVRPNSRDFLESTPCDAMTGSQTLDLFEIGFPIKQVLRQGAAVQWKPVPLVPPAVEGGVEPVQPTLEPVDGTAEFCVEFGRQTPVTGFGHVADLSEQTLGDVGVERPHVSVHAKPHAKQVVTETGPGFEGIVPLQQGCRRNRWNGQPFLAQTVNRDLHGRRLLLLVRLEVEEGAMNVRITRGVAQGQFEPMGIDGERRIKAIEPTDDLVKAVLTVHFCPRRPCLFRRKAMWAMLTAPCRPRRLEAFEIRHVLLCRCRGRRCAFGKRTVHGRRSLIQTVQPAAPFVKGLQHEVFPTRVGVQLCRQARHVPTGFGTVRHRVGALRAV